MDLVNLCRICTKVANPENSQKLFERSQKKILREIEQVAGILLKNVKDLPQNICQPCLADLEQAHRFRERCITAQQYFTTAKMKNTMGNRKKRIVRGKHRLKDDDDASDMPIEEIELPAIHEIKEESPLESDLIVKNETEESSDDGIDHLAHVEIQFLERLVRAEINEEEEVSCTVSDQNDKVQSSSKARRKNAADKQKKHFICDQCGNHFTGRQHFLTHLRRHAGDKQFQCELCPAKFFTHSELKRHMRRHTGERPFACKHCDRRFSDYSTRIKHERTHTNDRPFSCAQCGKAFTTTYILKNHMLIHTGERSFKCDLCNRLFQRQTHLVVHYRSIMHKQNEEKQQKSKHL